MSRTFSDFSKLPKGLFREERKTPPPPAPSATPRDADSEVLDYFGLSGASPRSDANRPSPPPNADDASSAKVGELEARLAKAIAERDSARGRVDELERELSAAPRDGELADLRRRLDESERERNRLMGECAHLRDVANRESPPANHPPPLALRRTSEPLPTSHEPRTTNREPRPALLAFPRDFAEAFGGELRELVLDALAESKDSANRCGRERRAAALDALLAANPPSGELGRRRAELRQILKNAGAFNDEQTMAALDRLGFKLVSGKKHWKLDYAGVRMPLAKTPSDFRANLNSSADMANRCF